jgi:hypothetical protein
MEYEVPISKRYLVVEGVVSPRLEKLLKSAPGMVAQSNERICVLSRAFDSVPIGFVFEVAFVRGNPTQVIKARSVVKAVTQQMSKPFNMIPRGWGTFTLFSFPDGVPALIQNLPRVDGRYEFEWDEGVLLSSEETWKAFVAEHESCEKNTDSEEIATKYKSKI